MSNPLKKAISKVGDLIGDFGDWYSGKDAIKFQNQLARENWEMQNAYNTPSAQMARYKDAGLNPNLIYGQSNTAGAIAAPGQPESGVGQIDKAAGTIASIFSTKAMLAEIANKKKQNSLLQSQADYVKEQTRGQAIENALKKQTLKSVGSGNPNDPYWYRDIKKHPMLNKVADGLGRFVGSVTAASPQWTVRFNGKEYTADNDIEALRLLELGRKAEAAKEKIRKGRWYERKDRGGR